MQNHAVLPENFRDRLADFCCLTNEARKKGIAIDTDDDIIYNEECTYDQIELTLLRLRRFILSKRGEEGLVFEKIRDDIGCLTKNCRIGEEYYKNICKIIKDYKKYVSTKYDNISISWKENDLPMKSFPIITISTQDDQTETLTRETWLQIYLYGGVFHHDYKPTIDIHMMPKRRSAIPWSPYYDLIIGSQQQSLSTDDNFEECVQDPIKKLSKRELLKIFKAAYMNEHFKDLIGQVTFHLLKTSIDIGFNIAELLKEVDIVHETIQ